MDQWFRAYITSCNDKLTPCMVVTQLSQNSKPHVGQNHVCENRLLVHVSVQVEDDL